MDGFWSSTSKWFSEKTSSPLYFTYVAFLFAWNWAFFQVLFLENSSLFSQPRIEYIYEHVFWHAVEWFPSITPWVGIILDCIGNLVWHVGIPALLTFFAIRYFPVIQKWALAEYLESRFERKRMFQEKQREYDQWLLGSERERSETLKEIVSEKEEQSRTEKKIEKTLSNEERWEMEYQAFMRQKPFYKFKQIIRAIYEFQGRTEWGSDSIVDPDIKALADAKGIITITIEEGNLGNEYETIKLTDKGRYFSGRYLENNPVN